MHDLLRPPVCPVIKLRKLSCLTCQSLCLSPYLHGRIWLPVHLFKHLLLVPVTETRSGNSHLGVRALIVMCASCWGHNIRCTGFGHCGAGVEGFLKKALSTVTKLVLGFLPEICFLILKLEVLRPVWNPVESQAHRDSWSSQRPQWSSGKES